MNCLLDLYSYYETILVLKVLCSHTALNCMMEFQDKLQSLAGQPSGYLESLPKKVKRRVTVLQELQVRLFKILH